MGLDTNGIRLMLYAKRLGADFSNVVTIGRQELFLIPEQLNHYITQFGIKLQSHFTGSDFKYSEPFFNILGAKEVDSIDYSKYENATIIHDMNQILPKDLKGKFSVVVDAGTLEHVFNFPVAIKNCMELIHTGGYYISITPANNFMGHGFYQFSPELFFSIFTPKNGFELIKLLICEELIDSQWYEVSKPKGGQEGRVQLINNNPTYLMCIARRLDDGCEPFKTVPNQSDYIEAWDQSKMSKNFLNSGKILGTNLNGTVKGILKFIPGLETLGTKLYRFCKRFFQRNFKKSFNQRDYTPFNPLR